MWLDRFGTHNSPQQSSVPWRKGSPLPQRRPSQLYTSLGVPSRPVIQQRDSSWYGSVTSNSAPTASSPLGLTAQLASPHDEPALLVTALATVDTLLGPVDPTDTADDARAVETSDFEGASLTSFANGNDNVTTDSALSADKHGGDHFKDLHGSVAACDNLLSTVEANLASFQADLAAVSSEIESLQARSTTLSTKLQHRKEVEQVLGPKLETLSVAPSTIRRIVQGPIDGSWTSALAEVEKVTATIKGDVSDDAKSDATLQDLRSLLEDVKGVAVTRVRDFVVSQIKALRTPGTNAQMVQRNKLLRQRDAYAFLAKNHPQLNTDISQAYVNTMKWYYQSNFSRYRIALETLKAVPLDKTHVLGNEDGRRQIVGSAVQDIFTLGRRNDVIRNPTPHAMPAHAAEQDQAVQHIEVMFRAFNVTLVDNAAFEYSFLTAFFRKSSYHDIDRMFLAIFEPTLIMGRELTKQLTDQTVDGLGVLLCVRLNQHFAFELQRLKVPSMELYINGTNMLLWPRFQIIMDMHCDSLRKAASKTKSTGPALAMAAWTGTSQGTAPHAVIQKYAAFLHGLLVLSTDPGDDEPVQRSTGRLKNEFDAFLTALAKTIGDVKKRNRFLLNNFALIGTVINDTEGRMALEMQEHYSALQKSLSDLE